MRQNGAIETHSDRVNRVNDITKRLVKEAVKKYPATAGWKWEIHVVRNPEPNASCLPGGKMQLNTGLWSRIGATDDEIAQVIAHEVSHALAGHAVERISIAKAVDFGTMILAAIAARRSRNPQATYDVTLDLSQYAALLAIKLPYSRERETEADRIGMELAAAAGFDPRAAATLWEKMAAAGGSMPEFLSTHPSPENRASQLAALAPKFEPLYRTALAQSNLPATSTSPNSNLAASVLPVTSSAAETERFALASTRRADVMALLFPAPSASKTPDMMTAVVTSDMESVAYYLANGVNINNTGTGSTYLIAAVQSGDIDMVRFLIAYGAAVNRTDAKGNTPLLHAKVARPPDLKLIELLIAAGARTYQ